MPKKKKDIPMDMFRDEIVLQWVRTHNLQNIDITIPKNKIITVTWVSGSGKSSLAFHTLYKEGQFRYIESLSSYLRQFFNLGTRPDLDYSSWLSPAIAIEQNKRVGNTRSTVGTLTEIDDYLRLLMAKLGDVYCYSCGDPLRPKTTEQIVDDIVLKFADKKVYMIQEIWEFEDDTKLWRWVRKNRRQVDQWGGVTRFLVEYIGQDGTETVEYFYLEDPKIPKKHFPIRLYGIFDRVTINDSTSRRLKDDIIKMLWRAEKFGVMVQDGDDDVEETTKKQDKQTYRYIILHGYTGRPEQNWLPNLKTQLELQWHEVHVPALPFPDSLALEDKVDMILKHATLDERTILVGHSLWSVVAMKVIEKAAKSGTKIWWFVSIAGISQWDLDAKKMKTKKFSAYAKEIKEKKKLSFQRKKIKETVEHIHIVWSPKDATVPFVQQQTLAKKLGVQLVDIHSDKDHFSWEKEQSLVEYIQDFQLWEHVWVQEATSISYGQMGMVWYTDKYYCAKCNIQYPEFTPQHFSANRQDGACTRCQGIWEILQADFDKILDPFSVYLQAVLPWRDSRYGQAILKKLAQKYDIQEQTKWKDLPEWFREVVVNGDEELIRVSTWWGKFVSLYYKGIEDVLTAQYNQWVLTVDFQAMLDVKACPTCAWARLRQESLNVFITTETHVDEELINKNDIEKKYNIFDLQRLSISELVQVIRTYQWMTKNNWELVDRITKPLIDRSWTIDDLGLGYIMTARKIDSLSWWEIQRLRLAKQLGNKLTWIMYVLDEPTIWLDEWEILKVIAAIKQLQTMGNTIVVVEHNEDFIRASDRIVEVGPWAWDFGGKILYNGTYDEFLKEDTLTAKYMNGEKKVTATFDHTPSTYELCIKKASKHNLKGIDVNIKLWSFTIITWPSGAGKTTLMYHTLFNFLSEKQQWIQSRIRLSLLREWLSRAEILQAPVMQRKKYEHLEQIALQEYYEYIGVETITWYESIENVLYVNQSSIWKTPRSCPATFIGVFDDIRKLYAGTTESKMLAFTSGHFSFNSKKWACPECNWYGDKKIELQFLPDTYVPCSLCKWRRYKPEILDIRWHDKSIFEVLDMYVKDAYEFLKDMDFIAEKLKLMIDIWLGYLKMWQSAHTLSGGESQRLKLVKHLLKSYRGHTIYFLDEPTVGLHASDIERLLQVLKRFLDNGDTILMIEHEKNLLQFADKVVRLENGYLAK